MKCLEEANSETKHRIEVLWSWGREGMGGMWVLLLNGYRVYVWDDEKVLKIDGGDGCTAL